MPCLNSGKSAVCHAGVDLLVMKYVINSPRSYHTVEDENFVALVKGLQLQRTVMCRNTFVKPMKNINAWNRV